MLKSSYQTKCEFLKRFTEKIITRNVTRKELCVRTTDDNAVENALVLSMREHEHY